MEMAQNFNHPHWDGGNLSREEKFDLSSSIVASVGVAWRRLVFYFEHPKFKLISSCDPRNSAICAEAVLKDIRDSKTKCGKCVDNAFTSVWLARLDDIRENIRSKAKRSLQLHAVTMPKSSTDSI